MKLPPARSGIVASQAGGACAEFRSRGTPISTGLLISMAALGVAASQVGDALFPRLLISAPWLLLLLNAGRRNLILLSTQLAPTSFFIIAITRQLVFDPFFFFLGRRYGDDALDWLASRTGKRHHVARARKLFTVAAWMLVPTAPDAIVCTVAGASSMSARQFFVLNVVGTVATVSMACCLAQPLSSHLASLVDAIRPHAWWLTGITVLLVIGPILLRRRKVATLRDGEHENGVRSHWDAQPSDTIKGHP